MTTIYKMHQLASREDHKAYDWTCPKTGTKRHYPATPPNRGRLPWSASTLYSWIRANKFPKPLITNGVPVWTEAMIENWLHGQMVTNDAGEI